MRNLHIIHAKNSPKYKLSNEASCLALNRTTKNSKMIQVWERGSCVVYVVNGALPIYLQPRMVGLGLNKLGNRLAPSLLAVMQPLEKREAERVWWWCGVVRPHPCWPLSPTPCAGGLLARPGSLPCQCLAQMCRLDGPSLFSLAWLLRLCFQSCAF